MTRLFHWLGAPRSAIGRSTAARIDRVAWSASSVRVLHRDAVEDLIREGRGLEKIVLARAVDLHLRYRTVAYGNKTVVFD